MTKVYHFSNKLIVMDKQYKTDKYSTIQRMMLHSIRAPVQAIYDAHEIWVYNRHTNRFEMYKNRGGALIKRFFASKGINIKCDAADMTAKEIGYRFEEPKDLFLFNLKF